MRTWYIPPALALTLLTGHTLHAALVAPRAPDRAVKEFAVTARRFAFEPARLEVVQGDHVKITLTTADGTHGFEIKKLNVREPVRRGSDPVVVEFDAEAAGTFEITCSEYCGTGHTSMKGVLVVRPK